MNHRFTNEERTFTAEHIAGGQEILDKEQDLGRKTTCVNVSIAVLVLESVAVACSVLILISLMFATGNKSGPHFPLMLTQVVTALIAHCMAILAAYKSLRGMLMFAVALNLLEVVLNIARLFIVLQSGKLLSSLL